MSFSEAKDSISSIDVAGCEITVGCVDGRVRCYDLRMGQTDVDVIGRESSCLLKTPTIQHIDLQTQTL